MTTCPPLDGAALTERCKQVAVKYRLLCWGFLTGLFVLLIFYGLETVGEVVEHFTPCNEKEECK